MNKLRFAILIAWFAFVMVAGAAPVGPSKAVPAGKLEPLTVQAAGDLGCCVLETDPITCFWTNRAFCEDKAKQAKVSSTFNKDKPCREVQACRDAGESSGRACR